MMITTALRTALETRCRACGLEVSLVDTVLSIADRSPYTIDEVFEAAVEACLGEHERISQLPDDLQTELLAATARMPD